MRLCPNDKAVFFPNVVELEPSRLAVSFFVVPAHLCLVMTLRTVHTVRYVLLQCSGRLFSFYVCPCVLVDALDTFHRQKNKNGHGQKPKMWNERSSMSRRKDEQTKAPPALWWESLDEECPITLEPLKSSPYPPFCP
jgi:hypothetical protein